MSNSELAKLVASVDAAWKDLHSFLAAVTSSQASKRDQAGWSVRDHVTHLAAEEGAAADRCSLVAVSRVRVRAD